MSNLFRDGRSFGEPSQAPEGDVVAKYATYLEAQQAVDYLVDQQLEAQLISIVGNDLKFFEQVRAKLSYPKAALAGALQGSWLGLFVGILLSFVNPTTGFAMIPVSVILGAGFWMLLGIVSYASQRKRRDFISSKSMTATSYDVLVTRMASDRARQLLQKLASQEGPRPVVESPAKRPSEDEQTSKAPPISPERETKERENGPARYADLPDGRPQYGVRVETEVPRREPDQD